MTDRAGVAYGRQAITTRYLGPTDHRGARVVARCEAGRITVPWDHALDIFANHRAAALALARKLGWDGEHYVGMWVSGGTADGYAHCYLGPQGND